MHSVRWSEISLARGFHSKAAAQHYIDRVCQAVAPDLAYTIECED